MIVVRVQRDGNVSSDSSVLSRRSAEARICAVSLQAWWRRWRAAHVIDDSHLGELRGELALNRIVLPKCADGCAVCQARSSSRPCHHRALDDPHGFRGRLCRLLGVQEAARKQPHDETGFRAAIQTESDYGTNGLALHSVQAPVAQLDRAPAF